MLHKAHIMCSSQVTLRPNRSSKIVNWRAEKKRERERGNYTQKSRKRTCVWAWYLNIFQRSIHDFYSKPICSWHFHDCIRVVSLIPNSQLAYQKTASWRIIHSKVFDLHGVKVDSHTFQAGRAGVVMCYQPKQCTTVDGRNPPNQLRWLLVPIIYQGLMQDFFHQQYYKGNPSKVPASSLIPIIKWVL